MLFYLDIKMEVFSVRYLLVAQSMGIYKDLEEYCMPMGIAYINGAMRKAGFDVDAINMLFESDPIGALKKRLIDRKIDVMMCGGLTSEYHTLKKLYNAAKEVNPNIIVVGGGGGFTSEPIIFSEMTGVDYAVVGEGEITNCELAGTLENHGDVSKVKGIVYRDDDGYHLTTPRDTICDLDNIPFPSYEGLSMDLYLDNQHVDGWYNYYAYYSDTPRMMPMLMARSCPFQCSFCFHPIGRGYRARSLDNFFEELEQWISMYNINGIALIDECFSIDRNRVIEFCQRIKQYNIKWACQMRAETYTDDVLVAMKDSGCIGACFGIESMSESVLKNMNKHLLPETVEYALALTYKYQLGCTGNFIFGAETENFKTMAESLKWHYFHAKKYKNRPVRHFAYVQTYPGSIYYNNAFQNGKISDKSAYIEASDWNLNITSLSQEDYEAMGDVICLCRMENYNCGDILDIIITSNKTADFTFRCSYCGNINKYHNFNRKKLSHNKIVELGCRNCNMMGDYILDKEQYIYDEYFTIPWFLGISNIEFNSEFFSMHGWNTIGFCGMNAFAKKMIKNIKKIDSVKVVFIYGYAAKPDIDYCGVRQIAGEDSFPEVNLIINADMIHRREMNALIEQRSNAQKILLETLIRIFINMSTENDKDSCTI